MSPSTKKLALELLLKLLGEYSPTARERRCVNVLERYARRLGYPECYVDDVGNLVASYGRGAKSIAFIGHIDTVSGKLPVVIKDGFVSGRGAVDAKGPLAAMFIGLSLAMERVNNMKVHAVAVVGEEGRSHGIRRLIDSGFKANYAVVCEPTGNFKVAVGYRGSCNVLIRCRAAGGHSSSPWLYESAFDKLLRVWLKIRERANGTSARSMSASLIRVRCGEGSAVVPRRGEALVNFRIPLGAGLDDVLDVLDSSLEEGCTYAVKEYTEPVKVSLNSLSVRALVRAILSVGLKPKPVFKLGTSDMNIIYGSLTEDVAAVGPGRPELSHTDAERISIDEYITGVEIYAKAVTEFRKLLTHSLTGEPN